MSKKINRIVLVVLDSIGIGAMPDAAKYGDEGAHTFGHIIEANPDLRIPNLIELGFCNIDGAGAEHLRTKHPTGAYGRMAELSHGKDTITGHWEIAGIYTEVPFQTYPAGFPADFIKTYEEAIGVGILGNYAASGTEVIEDLGPEHEKTGKPIVYTSADSVFQVAANTAVIPLARLYEMCEIARSMLHGDVSCGRVIARPYIIDGSGKRIRTSERKDYAVSPPAPTLLDKISDVGKTVYAVGKISDIFNGRGISISVPTKSNADGVDRTIEAIKENFAGLIFTNLVDFDSKYGHRRNVQGYGQAIEEFDARLPEILGVLREDDILMLCADHGNDPIHSGWDHTREYVPFVAFGRRIKSGINIGTKESFADIGATIADLLNVAPTAIGKSFRREITEAE